MRPRDSSEDGGGQDGGLGTGWRSGDGMEFSGGDKVDLRG